ncbi:hypothetical protein REPUB_Repub16aG0086800 [Reevesia pubescens]
MQTEEYFDPYCRWKRGKESDAIEIELDGFKREDMKVTLNRVDEKNSIISIVAESPRRLRKKIEIPNDHYDLEKLRAVISIGNLCLQLPKSTAASNKLEISTPKLKIINFLQESAEDIQKQFHFAIEYSYSKRKVVLFCFMLLASVLFAYKYYTECYGDEN